LKALAFDGFERLLSGFRRIMENESHAATPNGLAIERRRIEPQKTGTREMDLKFVAHNALAAGGIEPGNLVPIKFRNDFRNGLALHVWLPTEQAAHALVKIKNMAPFIHDQHAVFDRVEQGLEKRPLSSKALHHVLQTLGIKPANAIEDFVEEA